MAATQEPLFTLEQKEGDFEIRRYEPLLAAEVMTSGDRGSAISAGFRLLADYIFGNNTIQTQNSNTSGASSGQSHKIAMTVPVTQQQKGGAWKIRFMMPQNFTRETLPIPKNNSVTIIEEPSKIFAVVRFSGWSSESNLEDHKLMLEEWIQKKNLKPVGSPIYAFYNPPWSLPFLRRNECLIEISH